MNRQGTERDRSPQLVDWTSPSLSNKANSMLNLRPETPEDADSIRRLLEAAFPTPGEARLVDLLRMSNQLTASIVAELDGRILGHVAFSPVTVGSFVGAGLAPVAVQREHRKQGIAEKMIREGLSVCRREGFGFVVVLGEPEYYRRFGFLPASGWKLVDEYGGGNAFQALEWEPGSIPRQGGLVRYAPAFAALDETTPPDSDTPEVHKV